MNVLALPSALRQRLFALRQSRLWRDPLSVGLIIASLILNSLTLLDLVIKLRPLTYQVPIHYSSLSGFDQLGDWSHPYLIAGFAIGITTVNALLAVRSFGRSRVAAFYLLLGAVVVAVFSLIIANAFSAVS